MTEREERTYTEQSKYMSIILHLPQLFESQIIQKYKIANFQNNLAYLACKYDDLLSSGQVFSARNLADLAVLLANLANKNDITRVYKYEVHPAHYNENYFRAAPRWTQPQT